jgi:hypothetical protein
MFVGANAMTITVSPSAAGLSDAPDFSFDGIRTSNFSSIDLSSVGGGGFSFFETGFLPIASFDPGNFTPPGLNRATGATAYGLYIAFTASGTLAAAGPGMLEGSFSSINYTLKGDPGFGDTFSHFNAQHQVFCVGCAGDFTLANGILFPGGNDTAVIAKAGSTKPLPAAFVDLLFNATSASFFVSPGAPFSADLMTQFSNTSFVTNQYTTNLPAGVARVVTIGTMAGQGGAGSGQFANLPEPAPLLILGSGLLCLGLIRRAPMARRRPSPELTLTTSLREAPEGLRQIGHCDAVAL